SAVRDGIRLHRRIDRYTDAHPLFRRSRQRLHPDYRRYGGILIDLFYDHLLAVQWEHHHPQTLDAFVSDIHRLLRARWDELPPRMQHSMRYLLAHDLLRSYRHRSGVATALRGLERRLSRPSNLGMAIEELDRHGREFEADFTLFFPDLITHTRYLQQMLDVRAEIDPHT
ncbi:MAG: acyl carrier protein phosphodiesterase, partial [Candidatus Competibacterales bacterium]|nr:acyl carrier protein phosphodiesterase [Candidatus Competibacterales bacterium]